MDHVLQGTKVALSSHEYYDVGSYYRHVNTASQDAQIWFNRGLIWSYGFNHEESAECFKQAILHDSSCVLAYWGLAYAIGPNYNKPWDVFDHTDLAQTLKIAHTAILEAKTRYDNAPPVEKALINALQFRYPQELAGSDYLKWNHQYADAMKTVYETYSYDLDIATLYADSLMNLTPWKLWDINTGEPSTGAHTLQIKAIVDKALSQPGGEQHPGLLHIYIHLMEMSPTPEAALTVADNLRGLVPDSGHLQHMPTHLDVLCGDYRRAIASNGEAIRADQKYFSHVNPLKFYQLYQCHDYHFRIYAAMLSGQSRIALNTVAELEVVISDDLLRVESPPMADWLEGFLTVRVHVLVRFGRWQDLLDQKIPEDNDLYCSTRAMLYYGKGIAWAAKGNIEEAEKARELLQDAIKRVPESRTLFNNTCVDILKVAESMLDGELEYRKGNYEMAFRSLKEAMLREKSLPYDEPWGWMQPVLHAYCALLLEQQGNDAAVIKLALKMYKGDLGMSNDVPRALQHPNNVWSLHGLHECFLKLQRVEEAMILAPQLKMAIAIADMPIRASCFCRLNFVD
jgi:tetratricopeptide (TPR) repeat protein